MSRKALIGGMGIVAIIAVVTAVTAAPDGDPPPSGGSGGLDSLVSAMKNAPPDARSMLRVGLMLRHAGRTAEGDEWVARARSLDAEMVDAFFASRDRAPAAPSLRGACPESAGVDIIVSDLYGGLGGWGRFGDLYAYSIGTKACNIGADDADWIEAGVRHPVIAQNLYRLRAGQFEQIGMSWVKHSFFVFAESNICCDNCNGHEGNRLGAGCGDTYGAGLNGAQFRLGPRSEINAASGAITWPHVTPTPMDGDLLVVLAGRIQVHADDLLPSLNVGALYFGEGQYVAADDTADGNDDNNVSHSRMTFTPNGNNYIMFEVLPILQRRPAIEAWRDADPAVSISTVDVAADGRFNLAYKATDNGDGTWRYEYALHNYNSDRSGQAFRIPLPSGVAVTNIGFHDVNYHSIDASNNGEYDGTDWPGAAAAGEIAWATDLHATNANANALRWGTLYNFRFDANRPPVPRMATLDLFKPGSPASVAISTIGPDEPCTGDLDGDGQVNSTDLSFLLGAWGSAGPGDLDGSGTVNSTDVSFLLGQWGPCP